MEWVFYEIENMTDLTKQGYYNQLKSILLSLSYYLEKFLENIRLII